MVHCAHCRNAALAAYAPSRRAYWREGIDLWADQCSWEELCTVRATANVYARPRYSHLPRQGEGRDGWVSHTLLQSLHEFLNQRVNLLRIFGNGEMPDAGELQIFRARNGFMNFLLVLGRLAWIVEAAQEQQFRLERRNAVAHIERIDRLQ